MIKIVITFVLLYLIGFVSVLAINYVIINIFQLNCITYKKSIQIANSGFAVAILLVVLSLVFIFPIEVAQVMKRNMILAVVGISFYAVVILAFYDQIKTCLKQTEDES